MSLEGRRALVTGGASGIGRAIVEALQRSGAEAVVVDLAPGGIDALVGFVRAAAPQLAARGIAISALCPGLADTPIVDAALRERLGDFPLIEPAAVAEAALAAAAGEPGQAWVCQAGREPLAFRFPGVPGPREAGAVGRAPLR